MSNRVIGKCPICNNNLYVTRLTCTNCHTELTGNFTLSKFNYLEKDDLYFVEIFIKNQGNIKEVEKELNISYPTVKRILNDVIEKLGYKADIKPTKKDILQQLKSGEISKEEAAKLL